MATIQIGDIRCNGMFRVTAVKDGQVWELDYIGKEYIVERDGKYLHEIYRQVNTGSIIDTWSSEKWAMKFRPARAGVAVGQFSLERVMMVYNDITVIEV